MPVQKPLHRFASLKDCCPLSSVLQGYVYDCCPDTRIEVSFFQMVLQGCFGGLARQYEVPELWEWIQSDDSQNAVAEAASINVARTVSFWKMWEEHDVCVPRFFIYSSKDMLVKSRYVEKYFSTLRQRQEAPEIHTVQVSKSGHAQIFITEKDVYQKEIKLFISKLVSSQVSVAAGS